MLTVVIASPLEPQTGSFRLRLHASGCATRKPSFRHQGTLATIPGSGRFYPRASWIGGVHL